ncbi:hypothetical protein [Hydrogenophaga sp. H7]|uniref:hypothetical protein n=1 Tax=Hydrogenophaga sp. H7 TaxID=1882399 RepID=UPI00117A564B|nr:hypothetical protein [Hydrogenophaga sp. H7]
MASLAAAFLAFAAGHSLTPLFGSEAFGKSSGQFNQCVHLICMLPCDHPQSMTGEDDQRLLKWGKVVRFAAVAAVRVFNVNALGVPDCDHSYSCIVVMRRDRFQARS